MSANNKCGDCCFCNSLNALSAAIDHPVESKFFRQAQAVIEELCSKTDKIPFYAYHNVDVYPEPYYFDNKVGEPIVIQDGDLEACDPAAVF